MKKDEILGAITEIRVKAEMSKYWLNTNSVSRNEQIWKDLDSILNVTDKMMLDISNEMK